MSHVFFDLLKKYLFLFSFIIRARALIETTETKQTHHTFFFESERKVSV
jgi:hypothetical protein